MSSTSSVNSYTAGNSGDSFGKFQKGSRRNNAGANGSTNMASGIYSGYSTNKFQSSRNMAGKNQGSGGSHTHRSRRKRKDDNPSVRDEQGHLVTPLSLLNDKAAEAEESNFQMPSMKIDDYIPSELKSHLTNFSDSDRESDNEEENQYGNAQASSNLMHLVQEKSINKKTDKAVTTKKKEWTKKEITEKITVTITETDTVMLLNIPSCMIRQEDEKLYSQVAEENKEYDAILEAHKQKDKFSSKHVQTFNYSLRDKKVQKSPTETADSGSQVTTWDIYDSYLSEQTREGPTETNVFGFVSSKPVDTDKKDNIILSKDQKVEDSAKTSQVSFLGSKSNPLTNVAGSPQSLAGSSLTTAKDPIAYLNSNTQFKNLLNVMEDAVMQNVLHSKILLYRNHDEAQVEIDEDEEFKKIETPITATTNTTTGVTTDDTSPNEQPCLIPLWEYSCELTKGFSVTCLCWNKKNSDLVAAGYGQLNFGNTSTGMILFWSLKNPTYPQKIITTKFSVTSIDFSEEHAHLLAAGFYDGSVCIYDIRENSNKPDLMSVHATGKHSEPVWGVKWVSKDNLTSQKLTSVSTDGTVKQWSMKKGLVPHDLMQLTRIPNLAQLYGNTMEGISREASGFCFDFPINDRTQYFTGTEDGLLHKCSVSYNEQTLENFYGHTGPVYKVRCSPYNADAFLSCSADWTIILWSQKRTDPVLRIQSGNDYIMDIEWSPSNSCVFGSVSREGRIEVWDLEYSGLDPAIQFHAKKELTCVSFSKDAPVIMTGGADGAISVYRMHGVDVADFDKYDLHQQEARLGEILYQHNKQRIEVKREAVSETRAL